MLNELPAHTLESLGCLAIICAYLSNIVFGSYCIHASGAGFGNKSIWYFLISFSVNSLSSSCSFSVGCCQMTTSLLQDSFSSSSSTFFSSSSYSRLIMSSYTSWQLFIHYLYLSCSCFASSSNLSILLLCSVVKGLRIVNGPYWLLRRSFVIANFGD